MSTSGYYAVDLDGTLAEYHGWQGAEHIGPPVPAMLARVKGWLEAGIEVRIFTARASVPEQIPPIQVWCREHLGRELLVTNIKDFACVRIFDDRAIQVEVNTGRLIGEEGEE